MVHRLYRRMQPQFQAGFECAGSCRICGRCNLGVIAKTLNDFLANCGAGHEQIAYTVVTGSQVVDDLSRFLCFDTFVSEVSANIAAASRYYADCRAVLDVGGQDSEAIGFAVMFSQLWGKPELVELQRMLLEELEEAKQAVERQIGIDDTHRLVWLHLPPFYSSELMDFVELTCHAPVVFEEVNFVGWRALDPEEPYRSLARKLLTVGFLDPERRMELCRFFASRARRGPHRATMLAVHSKEFSPATQAAATVARLG